MDRAPGVYRVRLQAAGRALCGWQGGEREVVVESRCGGVLRAWDGPIGYRLDHEMLDGAEWVPVPSLDDIVPGGAQGGLVARTTKPSTTAASRSRARVRSTFMAAEESPTDTENP